MIRYRVLDLPQKGLGAFTPLAATNPVASSYGLVHVMGSLSTIPIPAPKPKAVPPISAQAETQSSYVAPDIILPDYHVPSTANMGPSQHIGMAKRRLTPIPVPALSWINTALNSMQTSKIGGRAAMAWPRAFQRWPTIGKNS